MLTFAHPWLALILPFPLLVVWLVAPLEQTKPGLRVPFFASLAALTRTGADRPTGSTPRGPWRLAILIATWCFAVLAVTRPQWIEPPLHRDVPTRDLLLLVDLSASMDTRDFTDDGGRPVTRLAALKGVLDQFLARRQGDRVAVVVFGDAPFTLVPFTTDLDLARRLVRETAVGMAGPRTAFGDAVGLGITMFDASTVRTKTMIALTDGNDTASRVPPIEAAGVAKDRGIVIHTVAIGDPKAAGEDKLDEAALTDIASRTGGGFYRALDRAQLAGIYTRLDEIETRRIDTVSFRPKTDLYWMPVIAGLLLSMLACAAALVGARRTRPAPRRQPA